MELLRSVFISLPLIALAAALCSFAATALRVSPRRVHAFLIAAILSCLLLHLIVFLHTTLAYAQFPYEQKSVVEGVVVYNAWRYANGEQPYRDPTIAPFRSTVYPPVHELLLAGVMMLLGGPSLVGGRVFSLACALGAIGVAWLATTSRARRRTPALLGGAFLICCYGLSLQWLEQVRNDALLVLLISLGLYLADRSAERERFPVGALVALLLATYTKQTALFAAAAVFVHLWFRNRRHAVLWALLFFVSAGVVLALMQFWSGGWFAFYVIRVPVGVGLELRQIGHAVTFALVTLIALAAAAQRAVRLLMPGARRSGEAVWGLAFFTGLPVCLLQSLKWGATMNAFLPLMPIVGILAAVSLDAALSRWDERRWAPVGALSLALIQVGILHYRPLVPGRVHYEGQERIAHWVRTSPGDVLVSGFSSQAYRNGKRYWGDPVIMGDLERAGLWRGNELLDRVRRGELALLMLRPESQEFGPLVEASRGTYVLAERIHIRNDIGGWPYMLAYVPKAAPWRPAEDTVPDTVER